MEIDFLSFSSKDTSNLLSLIQTNGARILGFSVNGDRWIFSFVFHGVYLSYI